MDNPNIEISSIEERKPLGSTKIIDYIKKVKEMSEKKYPPYYVPYCIQDASKAIVNCYAQNKVNQLTIEYDIPCNHSNESTKKVKLIIAENTTGKMGDFVEIKKIISSFFKKSANLSIVNALNPEAYIAYLERSGWKFTPEGLDIMLVTKSQGMVEIKKTKFTAAEFEKLSETDFEENRIEHEKRIEDVMINQLENYIISTYKKINVDNMPELQKYKENVLRYSSHKKTGIKNSTDLLDVIFRELKPIKEHSRIIPLLQRSWLQNIESYLDMIPWEYRKNDIHYYLKQYIKIRFDAIEEKENNNGELMKNSECIYRLYKLEEEHTNLTERRNELRKKVDAILERENTSTNDANEQHDISI